MPGKSNNYTLGEFGVNRVKSPIHLDDGELLTAQNADVPFEKGNRGLRKRSGMAKLNTDAAAGSIEAMTWVPLPDPDGILYSFFSGTSYRVSDDGLAWVTRVLSFGAATMLGFQNRLWFFSSGELFSFDGQGTTSHGADAAFLDTSVAIAKDVTNTAIVVTGANNAFGNLAGYRYNILTDTWTAFTPPVAPGPSIGLAVLSGTAYVGTSTTAIYRSPPAAGSLVLEFTIGSAVNANDMTVFGGKVYASCSVSGVDPNTNKILRRDGVGVWTAVVNTSGEFRYIEAVGSNIFALRFQTSVRSELWASSDGTTWAMESDLAPFFGLLSVPNGFFSWNGFLFIYHGANGIYRRNAAGVVSLVDATASGGIGTL